MNIAMLQAMSAKPAQVTAPKQTEAATQSSVESNEFGAVFNSVMSASEQPKQMATETTETTVPVEEVEATLVMESLKDLFAELGIELDEAELFAMMGEEGEMVALDQLLSMDLEELTAMLDLTEEELTDIVSQLLGEEMEDMTDVWALIEQAPAILAQITAALQSNEQVPKEMHKVVQLLKVIEFVGKKTDTVYQQEFKLTQLTEALKATVAQVQQEAPKTTSFQQTVQQVAQTTQTTPVAQTTTKVETETTQIPGQQQPITQTKTITVTLPAEKPAQSEALLKEIQQLINRSQLSGQPGNMKLLLKLFPENLGQIRIELTQQNGVLTARLLASTALGKELLDTNLNQLKASFVAQNIQMDRIDITQSLQETDRGGRDQNFFNNFFRQQAEQQDEEEVNEDEEKVSFQDLLTEQQEEVE